MRAVLPTAFVAFVVGGLLSGMLGLRNLTAFLDRSGPAESTNTVTTSATPVVSASHAVSVSHAGPTPRATLQTTHTSSASSAVSAVDSGSGWSFLYVIAGDLWVTGRGVQAQLTQGAQISHPALSDDSVAFVERQRNASDIWLASADAPLRPVTQNASPIVSQNHWASQPVFLPGGQRLYVAGDFNKSSTGPGNLAVWELTLQERAVIQITQPPEYAGGDQDITVDPVNPRQIVFTRYAYSGTRLVEQLEWIDVRTDAPVPLTPPDQPSRQANYSPDGTTLAFIQSGQGTNQDLWIGRIQVGTDGPHLENARRAVTGVLANPVWSPDGAELAYIGLTRDQFQLWTLHVQRDANGAIIGFGQPHQITSGPGVDATSRPVFMTSEQAARVRDWLSGRTLPS